MSEPRLTSHSLFADFFIAATKQPQTPSRAGFLVLDVFFRGGLFDGPGSIYVYMEDADTLAGLINAVLSKGVNSVVAYSKGESGVGGTTAFKKLETME